MEPKDARYHTLLNAFGATGARLPVIASGGLPSGPGQVYGTP